MKSLLLAVLTAGLSVLCWQAVQKGGLAPGYPLVVAAAALFCTLVYLAASLRGRAAAVAGVDETGAPETGWRPSWRLLVFVAIWLAYVALLNVTGFAVGAWLALWASLAVLGGRLRLRTPLLAAAFVVVLAALLKTALYVPVPQGWLDVQLDILIYSFR